MKNVKFKIIKITAGGQYVS